MTLIKQIVAYIVILIIADFIAELWDNGESYPEIIACTALALALANTKPPAE